jgi:hypothetical protein
MQNELDHPTRRSFLRLTGTGTAAAISALFPQTAPASPTSST